MASDSLVERLSRHKTVGGAPDEEIRWVADHGRLHCVESGGVLTPKEGPVEGLHVVLEGHLAIHVDRGAGPKKVAEWYGGDVTGVLPYSRIVAPPADVVAVKTTEVLTVARQELGELIRQCPELTSLLVHVMVDRARHFTSSFQHDEKLVSLGKLAAGLAHELNNPVSAITRSAGDLSLQLTSLEDASRLTGAVGLTNRQLEQLSQLCDSVASRPVLVLSPLEQEEREESIRAWLENRNLEVGSAEAFADAAVTVDTLECIAKTVDDETLGVGLQWFAAALAVRRLNAEIKEASTRVHGLVAAVKEFTQMDRAIGLERVDVERGLSNTLVVVGAKAKAKSVVVRTDIATDVPPVLGSAGELNQVWSNLIDNALDAVPEQGHVDVVVRLEGETVVVRVIDDGPGIPADVRDRIFDPFFTTKPVGEGTGLGLDIVRRLIQRHGGRIEVSSTDGRTEFRVELSVSNATADGNA